MDLLKRRIEKLNILYTPPFIFYVVLGYHNIRRGEVVGGISVTTPYISYNRKAQNIVPIHT